MKKNIHPDYHPVIFQDMTTGKQFVTRSTAKSDRVENVKGVDHFVISIGVTSDSHPFFTGKSQFVDTEGRIDKFQKRFGAVRRAKKPTRPAETPAAPAETPAAPAETPAAPAETPAAPAETPAAPAETPAAPAETPAAPASEEA